MTKDQAERLEYYILDKDPKVYYQTVNDIDWFIVTSLPPWTDIRYENESTELGKAFTANTMGMRWRYE